MHARRSLLIAAVLAPLVASVAHATPADDLRRGTTIHFDRLTFDLHGARGVSGLCLDKPAGTLDFSVNVRDLGIPADFPVRFRGEVVGHTVHFRFEEYFAGIEVAPIHWVSGVRGDIVVDLATVPFQGRSCGAGMPEYNVGATTGSGSFIEVRVHNWFSQWWEPASNIVVEGVGGLPAPHLTSLTPARRSICASATQQTVDVDARLTGPAPSGGAPVIAVVTRAGAATRDLWVRGMPAVAAGSSSTTLRVVVEPWARGAYRLTGRSPMPLSDVATEIDVQECIQLPWWVRGLVFEPRPWWRDCWACQIIGLTARGEAVMRDVEGRLLRAGADGELVDLAKLAGGTIYSVATGAFGQLVGTIDVGEGKRRGFVLDRGELDAEALTILEDLLPLASNAGGDLLATAPDGGKDGDAIVLLDGSRVSLVPPEGGALTPVAMDGFGRVVGGMTDKQGQSRAFAWDPASRELVDLGDLGGGQAWATLASDGGFVAGVSATEGGEWHPFVVTPEGKLVDLLEGEDGWIGGWPVLASREGLVVYWAYDKQGQTVQRVWSPWGRFAPAKLSQDPAVVVERIDAIGDDGTFAVTGSLDGKPQSFALRAPDGDGKK